MSHISKLKLSSAKPETGPLPPKERARAKALSYLQHQRALAQGELTGEPYLPYRSGYRTNAEGESVRVQQPMHIRRGWFEGPGGTLMFSIRYGAKPLPLDKAGNTAIEIGQLDALPATIDTLIQAVQAGELDAQLAAAAQERRKNFRRQTTKTA